MQKFFEFICLFTHYKRIESPPGINVHEYSNPWNYCQNCKRGISDDLRVILPRPVNLADFLNTCTKPWLHYGYCQHCMAMASNSNTDIIKHITHCEALFGNCWDGRHEHHIHCYKQRFNLISKTSC